MRPLDELPWPAMSSSAVGTVKPNAPKPRSLIPPARSRVSPRSGPARRGRGGTGRWGRSRPEALGFRRSLRQAPPSCDFPAEPSGARRGGRPPVVGVRGRRRAVRDGVAEGDDDSGLVEAVTSTPTSQNHACVVVPTGMSGLAVKSPGGETYDVCNPSKCHVAGPVAAAGTKRLTARSPSAGTSSPTGSLSTTPLGGMVMDGFPLKVARGPTPARWPHPSRAGRCAPRRRPGRWPRTWTAERAPDCRRRSCARFPQGLISEPGVRDPEPGVGPVEGGAPGPAQISFPLPATASWGPTKPATRTIAATTVLSHRRRLNRSPGTAFVWQTSTGHGELPGKCHDVLLVILV